MPRLFILALVATAAIVVLPRSHVGARDGQVLHAVERPAATRQRGSTVRTGDRYTIVDYSSLDGGPAERARQQEFDRAFAEAREARAVLHPTPKTTAALNGPAVALVMAQPSAREWKLAAQRAGRGMLQEWLVRL